MVTETVKNSEKAISEKMSKVASIKANADIVNFYQFVYDNNLRKEAKLVLDSILKALKPKKKTRRRRTKKQ